MNLPFGSHVQAGYSENIKDVRIIYSIYRIHYFLKGIYIKPFLCTLGACLEFIVKWVFLGFEGGSDNFFNQDEFAPFEFCRSIFKGLVV